MRKKASKVPVETLDADHFMHLLQELFPVRKIVIKSQIFCVFWTQTYKFIHSVFYVL